MKHALNAAGLALVQASELSKRKNGLARSILALPRSFDVWMHPCIWLSAAEQVQHRSLGNSFKALAVELTNGRGIGFAKEKLKEEDYRDKDILIFGTKRQTYSLLSELYSSEESLQGMIRYG